MTSQITYKAARERWQSDNAMWLAAARRTAARSPACAIALGALIGAAFALLFLVAP